jgi:hypothetical protein
MNAIVRGVVTVACGLVVVVLFKAPLSVGGPAPAKRVIHMAAIEPRGGVAASIEPFPASPLPSGPGYVLRPPDATGRWEVSGYYWQPGFIVVGEGDEVTLEILGINGAEHPTTIEGINVAPFTVRRGQITTVQFRAGRPGFYRMVCSTHLPTMVGHLAILPRTR